MAKAKRNIMVAAAMTALALTGRPAAAADRRPTTLVVHVYDQAHVGSSGLATATAQTELVFAAVGVRLVWADPDVCMREASHLHLRLVPPDELAARGIREGVLGWAARAEQLALVSPERVQLWAEKKAMNERLLLGRVIAHELGHLLLGTGHSRAGIMTVGINAKPKAVEARFTPEEARSIRELLESKAASREEGEPAGESVARAQRTASR